MAARGGGVHKRPAAAARVAPAAKRARPAAAPPTVLLSNGTTVPVVGFGTAFFYGDPVVRRPEVTYTALPAALDAGYRHIDSAAMYGNERQVGNVLGRYFMEGKLARDDVFVTTKVGHPPTTDYPDAKTQYLFDPERSAYDGALEEFYGSLRELGLGYVDLLLIHWPGLFEAPQRFPEGWGPPRLSAAQGAQKRRDMWAALERAHELGLARAIGVSNFSQRHLQDILPASRVRPMMNQIEIHPYLQQNDLVDFCDGLGIRVTAYSPLAGGALRVLEDEALVALAARKRVTPAGLVLSWLLSRGIVVIPKSSSPGRAAENLAAPGLCCALGPEDLRAIAVLDCGRRMCPDPESIP